MKFNPILIVAGEPIVFFQILFKSLNNIKISKPIILIASTN